MHNVHNVVMSKDRRQITLSIIFFVIMNISNTITASVAKKVTTTTTTTTEI
jgi:hypothetical protein